MGRTYPFIHNSIGLSHCRPGGDWSLKTFWQQAHPDGPSAFFVPDASADWVRTSIRETGAQPYYWLFDGFLAHDVLFIGLLRVEHAAPRGRFNLPFRLVGMDLARIENYRDSPTDWRIQISTLSNDTEAFPGSAFVVTESALHAFAFFQKEGGRSPRMLGRLDLGALRDWRPDLSTAWEYLGSDSQWQRGFAPRHAKVVMTDDATEMSVHFDELTNEWIAVYSAPGSGTIWMRRAEELVGPWSKPRALFEIPEMVQTTPPHRDPNLFCYAGKAHPQFAAPDRLLMTYVCNLFARDATEISETLRRLQDTPSLYRPRSASIAIPPRLHHPRSPEATETREPGLDRPRP